jgi:hypothetical protein
MAVSAGTAPEAVRSVTVWPPITWAPCFTVPVAVPIAGSVIDTPGFMPSVAIVPTARAAGCGSADDSHDGDAPAAPVYVRAEIGRQLQSRAPRLRQPHDQSFWAMLVPRQSR